MLFRLIGTKSNRGAIGARVRVTTPKMPQIDEVHAGGSYNSSNDTRLHFGLGTETTITKIEIFWPSGLRQEFTNVAADAIYEIKEGEPIRKDHNIASVVTHRCAIMRLARFPRSPEVQ